MPPRKAGARKRKQRPDADEGVLEEKQNDQVKEDKQNDVGAVAVGAEKDIQDSNALVDQVLKKYKLYECAAPFPEPAHMEAPRRTEGEQTPQGDMTSRPHGSTGDKENVGDMAVSVPDLGKCSRRMASLRRRGTPGGTGPDPGKCSSRMASLRKSTLASGKSSPDNTMSRLRTPELPPSPDQHSTPYPVKDTLHNTLFGFEDLESPLVLTPLVLSPVKRASDSNVIEQTPKRRSAEHQHVQQWNTPAVIHGGPKQRHKSRNRVPPSVQQEWIQRINEEFKSVEEYDLIVQ